MCHKQFTSEAKITTQQMHSFVAFVIADDEFDPWFDYHRYVDDTMRIGRDDKGNIFILERSETNWGIQSKD